MSEYCVMGRRASFPCVTDSCALMLRELAILSGVKFEKDSGGSKPLLELALGCKLWSYAPPFINDCGAFEGES